MAPHGALENPDPTGTYKTLPSRIDTCPNCRVYRLALQETIEILLKTKGAFKSKLLGTLRRRLQQLLNASS